MSWCRLLLVVGVMAGGTALAADMPDSWAPPPAPPTSVWPLNGNWYLRGDLGYAWGHIGSAQAAPGFPDPTDNKFGSSFIGGIGAGYKGGWLRTDITLDYSRFKYSGTFEPAGDASAKVGVLTALFNGYLDLGTWYGLTPYIGAGAGAALVKLTDFQSTALPPSADSSDWRFAWAGMAGVAWAVSPNVQIDFGYRYLDVGKVRSGAPGEVTFNNVAGHEVRLGVRWNFNDLVHFR